jgi:hypothetical protein
VLCVTLSISIIAAEVASAAWKNHLHPHTVVPIGVLRADAQTERPVETASSAVDIALPLRFSEPSDQRDINVVVLGESSAEGVPYNGWLSIGAIVTWQLDELLPGKHARLHLLARMGDTLELQHRKLAELTRRPDLLIVYAGHNEFASRFPPAREVDHYGDQHPSFSWGSLLDRGERVSSFCGLIRETADKCRLALPAPPGRGTYVDVPAYTPSEYAALLADFRHRLESIASYSSQIGAIMVLVVPPSNDADFEPNRSFLPPTTRSSERAAFEREFRAARAQETTDPAGARSIYEKLVRMQPGFAEARYRLGKLLDRAGASNAASQHYAAARDLDGYPIRCPGSFQEVCRFVAKEQQCILVDGQAVFQAIGRHGLLDDHLFQDAMHPNLRGHIALAQAVLSALHARGAWGWPAESTLGVIDPARCARHFGMEPGSWKFVCSIGAATYVKMSTWTHDGRERLRRAGAFGDAAQQIARGAAPESVGLPNIGIPDPVPILRPEPLSYQAAKSTP